MIDMTGLSLMALGLAVILTGFRFSELEQRIKHQSEIIDGLLEMNRVYNDIFMQQYGLRPAKSTLEIVKDLGVDPDDN